MAKKASAREAIESIDLALRFKNDGGPVFRFLSEQKNSLTRCERVRQLLYLGLLREKELTNPATVASAPMPSDAPVIAHGPRGKKSSEGDKPTSPDSAADFQIHAEDLGEIFGAAG